MAPTESEVASGRRLLLKLTRWVKIGLDDYPVVGREKAGGGGGCAVMQRRSGSWSHREAISGGNAAYLTCSGEPASAVPPAMAAAAALPSSALSCRRNRPGSFSHGGQLLRGHVRRLTLPAAPPSSPATAVRLRRFREGHRGIFCVGASEGSPADILGGFYSSVNGKDMKTLGELWSDDCLLEDLSISARPFQGRKVTPRREPTGQRTPLKQTPLGWRRR